MTAPTEPRIQSTGPAPVERPFDVAFLVDRAAWLVQLRWIALGLAGAAIGIGTAVGAVAWPEPLAAITAVGLAVNVAFARIQPRLALECDERLAITFITAQLTLDLVAVAALLHWSGGTDNPFSLLFVVPMALAGMLLSLRRAMVLGIGASVVHGGIVIAEIAGVLDHHPLMIGSHALHDALEEPLWQAPEYLIAYLVAFLTTMLGIAWFVSSLVGRLRESEARRREHERIALSRERLARIGTVAAGVAHTVRNPLHGVLNCVELLRRRHGADAGSAELLELMEEGAGRIESVTRRLLALTREAGVQKTPGDPARVVRDALRYVESLAGARSVRLEASLDPVPPVEMDADRLVEALVNLLENAIHACGSGGRVRVTLAPDAGSVRLVIEDTGTGIPPELLERVFDPFFTTKPVGEGSGLGLPLSRRIVDEHGGRVVLQSAPGEGTRVAVELPAFEEERVA